MDDREELEPWLRLTHSWNPCLREINRCLQRHEPGRAFTDMAPSEASRFLEFLIDALPKPDTTAMSTDRRWLERADDHHLLPITDPRYPWLLREIPDPPLTLYVKGDPQCLGRPGLSIVGSRNPTPQGRDTASRFGKTLADAGFAVASGMALGIDGCAHRGALQSGVTIGVCAHGLDTVYPRAHRSLADSVRANGALISEFPIGILPRRHHFPRRNRLISGISLGTVVVEAGSRSGSLITARLAAEQNREVFAVPGSISAPQSRGCHELIRNGATLVESLDDILGEFDQYCSHRVRAQPLQGSGLRNEHAWFLEHMGWSPCTRDELAKRSALTPAEVSSMLLVLELEGCVELCPGGTYVRVARS